MNPSEPPTTLRLRQGTLEVREVGQGIPLLFLHGAFTDSSIWNDTAARLAPLGYRCILPTLPLGSHRIPQPSHADLTPPGLAALIVDLITTMQLGDAVVISNDTATALLQLILTNHPGTVRAAVITSGDAYECFPPPVFASLKVLPYVPGGLQALARVMRHPFLARQPWAFGRLSRTGMTRAQARQWSQGMLHDPGVRRDTLSVIQGFHHHHTLAAATRFPVVDTPIRIVWGRSDTLFPRHLAERLARELAGSDLHFVEGAATYIQLDRPEPLAELVHDFAARQHGAHR